LISGIGVDIIEIKRIKEAIIENERFLNKVFTPKEIELASSRRGKYEYLSARFAAKEASIKALGRGISWKEVEVLKDKEGRPVFRFYGRAKRKMKGKEAFLSLSHSREYALALVVVEDEVRSGK